jgi:hypothetical protein
MTIDAMLKAINLLLLSFICRRQHDEDSVDMGV